METRLVVQGCGFVSAEQVLKEDRVVIVIKVQTRAVTHWVLVLPSLALFKAFLVQLWHFPPLTCKLQLGAKQTPLDLTEEWNVTNSSLSVTSVCLRGVFLYLRTSIAHDPIIWKMYEKLVWRLHLAVRSQNTVCYNFVLVCSHSLKSRKIAARLCFVLAQ